MSKRSWMMLAVFLNGALVLSWTVAGFPATRPADDVEGKSAATEPVSARRTSQPKGTEATGKSLFGLTKIHDFHLEIAPGEYEKMQPVGGGMPFPGGPGGFGPIPGGPGQPFSPPVPPLAQRTKTTDTHKGRGWSFEFPWVKATFSALGKKYPNTGIRYKGNFTYMASAQGLKRNWKIDFNHYNPSLHFHGLKMLNLNSGITDPTKAREALSYAVFRAAGLPAPRTAFAQVTLTVPGKYEQEYVGLFTLIEQVDKTFLKDRFKSARGLLLKPEGVQGLEYLGDDWEPYAQRYFPKTEAGKKQQKRLMEFTRLIHRADDEQFRKEIGSYLAVDDFLRFVAVNALLANLDSFLAFGHNYFLYLRPDTNQFVFIPWDLDLSLGRWPPGGTPEQQMDLSINHPYPGENKLIDRLFGMKDVKEKYQKLVQELTATCFTQEGLLKDLEAIEKALQEPLAREAKAEENRREGAGGFPFGPPGGGMFGPGPSLKTFLEKRTGSVAAQLAGTSKGYVPGRFFPPGLGPGGPGGPPGGPGMPPGGPGGFGPGNFWARPLLEALDTDQDGKVSKEELLAGAQKFFNDCDKDKKGKIKEQALAEGLNRLFPPPPGFGPPGNGPPPGPPGFGPGMFLAGPLLKRADTDKDGQLSRAECLAFAEVLFKENDKDKKGHLDEATLAPAINKLFPPPPAFGPPGEPGDQGPF